MTNWPGLTEVTALPTSSTMPQYSCPIGVGCGTALMPRYGHRSDPHTHVAEFLMMASVGLAIVGVSRSSKRTSRGPYRIAPRMVYLLVFQFAFSCESRGYARRSRQKNSQRPTGGVSLPRRSTS